MMGRRLTYFVSRCREVGRDLVVDIVNMPQLVRRGVLVNHCYGYLLRHMKMMVVQKEVGSKRKHVDMITMSTSTREYLGRSQTGKPISASRMFLKRLPSNSGKGLSDFTSKVETVRARSLSAPRSETAASEGWSCPYLTARALRYPMPLSLSASSIW